PSFTPSSTSKTTKQQPSARSRSNFGSWGASVAADAPRSFYADRGCHLDSAPDITCFRRVPLHRTNKEQNGIARVCLRKGIKGGGWPRCTLLGLLRRLHKMSVHGGCVRSRSGIR